MTYRRKIITPSITAKVIRARTAMTPFSLSAASTAIAAEA